MTRASDCQKKAKAINDAFNDCYDSSLYAYRYLKAADIAAAKSEKSFLQEYCKLAEAYWKFHFNYALSKEHEAAVSSAVLHEHGLGKIREVGQRRQLPSEQIEACLRNY